ncbi:MAG TPA: hypothetical protein VN372_06005 [Methanospirillum sp.]|nr:hypothetical protein [Methanospirillum sp.]
MSRLIIDKVTDIRSDLLPELEIRFGEVPSKVEKNRIYFNFRTEEHAICGQASIGDYIKNRDIPGRVACDSNRIVTLVIGEMDD